MGLAWTHAYRLVIKKRGWTSLPLGRMSLALISGTVFTTILWFASFTSLHLALDPSYFLRDINESDIVGLLMTWGTTIFVWSLLYYSVHAFERYRTTEVERWKFETLARENQLLALKHQLNPHFLFNALNAVTGFIRNEQREQAVSLLLDISDLLRDTIACVSVNKILLSRELAMTDRYLAIVKKQFPRFLQVAKHIDSGALRISVPIFVVQPLCENAVKYSRSGKSRKCRITLSGKVEDGFLELSVTNAGSTLPEAFDLEKTKGIGLSNIRNRLMSLYGKNHQFDIFNSGPAEVTARIRIPAEKVPSSDE